MPGKVHALMVVAAVASLALAAGAAPAPATFPGTNGKIAFASNSDGDYDVYLANADGSDPVNVTKNGVYDAEPAVSANGKQLAYASNSGVGGDLDIYVRPVAGGDAKALTGHSGQDNDPAWSPDGKRIAFASDRDGDFEIYVVSVEGGDLVKLTSNTTDDVHPAWSPNGLSIAFASGRDGDDEIYVYTARTLKPAQLTSNGASDRRPSWSPDGKRIAFSSDRDLNYEIYRMEANGGDQLRLTNNGAFDSQPSWSPDGTKIAFASERPGQSRLWRMDFSGGGQKELVSSPASSENPDWGRRPDAFQPLPVTQAARNVGLTAYGTYVRVSFEQNFPSKKARVELWKPEKKAGAVVRSQTKNVDEPTKGWLVGVLNLEPGTLYQLRIVMVKPTGGEVEYVHPQPVTTLKRNVRVRMDKIEMHDDSDPGSCGEFVFDFLVGGIFERLVDDVLCDGGSSGKDIVFDIADFKDDLLPVKILGVDSDKDNSFFGGPYGSEKDEGEWSEGIFNLPVGAKDYTSLGENYGYLTQPKVGKLGSGAPRFTVRMFVTVRHQ